MFLTVLGILGGLRLAAKAFRVFVLMYGKTPGPREIAWQLSGSWSRVPAHAVSFWANAPGKQRETETLHPGGRASSGPSPEYATEVAVRP